MKKARLLEPIDLIVDKDKTIRLDRRTALIYLSKTNSDIYWFCIKKLWGTGRSAIGLLETEFKWI